jgi:hypothetical protein
MFDPTLAIGNQSASFDAAARSVDGNEIMVQIGGTLGPFLQ